MKSPAASDFHWKIALWVSFLTIVVIFAFGFRLRV